MILCRLINKDLGSFMNGFCCTAIETHKVFCFMTSMKRRWRRPLYWEQLVRKNAEILEALSEPRTQQFSSKLSPRHMQLSGFLNLAPEQQGGAGPDKGIHSFAHQRGSSSLSTMQGTTLVLEDCEVPIRVRSRSNSFESSCMCKMLSTWDAPQMLISILFCEPLWSEALTCRIAIRNSLRYPHTFPDEATYSENLFHYSSGS